MKIKRSCKLSLQFHKKAVAESFALSDAYRSARALHSSKFIGECELKKLILGVFSVVVATILMKSIVYDVTFSLPSLRNFSQLFSRVPEPFTMVLIGGGLIVLSVWRRKRLINKH